MRREGRKNHLALQEAISFKATRVRTSRGIEGVDMGDSSFLSWYPLFGGVLFQGKSQTQKSKGSLPSATEKDRFCDQGTN